MHKQYHLFMVILALSGLICLLLCSAALAAPGRVALVIGNGAYQVAPLYNPENDASDMATVLKGLGFEVILRANADRRTMIEAVQEFGRSLPDGGVGLFYYSGHGVQSKGLNYLTPLAANIQGDADFEFEALNANRVLAQMEEANQRGVNVVILDACRTNPYKGYLKSPAAGLAPMDAAGSLIAYATAANTEARGYSDDRNSVYTKHLLDVLQETPFLSVTDLFVEVARRVAEETDHQQRPWLALSLTSLFRFAELAPTPVPPIPVLPTPMPANTWIDPVTGMEFVRIPAGCFQMGQTEIEKQQIIAEAGEDTYQEYYRNELPRHEVCVEEFWIGKYGVTNAQFRQFKRDHDSNEYEGHSLNGNEQPAVYVSWDDAKAFTDWLTKQHQGKYAFRLPTEAEWEYAARAGTTTARFWGDDSDDACRYANVADQTAKQQWSDWTIHGCDDSYVVTAPVGSFRPNQFGLYDMLGNAWEWCQDWYASDYYASSPRHNPQGPSDGSGRVVRGGSWDLGPWSVRSANRSTLAPSVRLHYVGLRLVRKK